MAGRRSPWIPYSETRVGKLPSGLVIHIPSCPLNKMKGPFPFKPAGAAVTVGMSGVGLGLGALVCNSPTPVGALLVTVVADREDILQANNKSNARETTMIFR